MKNQLFALIGLGLLLATASAYAQTGVVKANVPFNFIVEKTQIPAGHYMFHTLGISGTAMSIESPDRKLVKLFLPNACETPQSQDTTKLVFHRYGDQYFLAQIWTREITGATNCPRPSAKSKSRWMRRSRMLS